jgi:cytochrome c553
MTREKFMNRFHSIRAGMGMLKRAAVLALVTTVAACTAGGPSTTPNQQTTPGGQTAAYTGPAAANADTQSFQNALWVNIVASGAAKCGNCHSQTGGQSPMFARTDDVNAAYTAAAALVNFATPDQSTLVLKVGSGHNCWLADATACHDTMLTWIKNWVGTSGSSTSTDPPLTTPPSSDVGGGKQFPATATTQGSAPPDSFKDTVYPLLSQFCSGCHQAAAASPQTPYFAAPDVDVAYAAAQAKINLNTPEQSRFYVRLNDEHHNCWTTSAGPADCAGSSAAMLAAIKKFADGISVTPVDTSLVLSKALKLKDGTVASGGNRAEANLVAKYEFKTGTGTTAYDTSGVTPAADLQFSGDVSWAGGWGINVGVGGMAKALTATSAKIASMITSSGEFTIETWAAPANVAQTNAWIVSYSGSDKTRNVTLGQSATKYQGATRSDKTDANGGTKPLLTDPTTFPVQAALTHIVLTYDPVNGQKLYMNGVDTGAIDTAKGGSLASWDNTFALVLGAETTGKEQWLGTIKFVAIHNRALTKDQVTMNYTAGVGEKYFMLFDVTDLTGVPQSYIKMTGAVLDSYAYQLSAPSFISLNPNATIPSLPLKGIRIGVNGIELPTGQSYATVNTTVTAAGQSLSDVGAVVAADKGVDTDMFFLTFEQIGTHSHAHTEPAVPVSNPTFPAVQPSRKGVKNFAQINSALSAITGVPVNNATVNKLYGTLQQSLPPTNDLGAFLASHQTAISALADQYCNIAVNTNTATMFPGLTLTNANAATYFANQANRNFVIDPLVARAIGTNVNTTVETAVRTELNTLIPTLAAINSTTAGRTASITQAACTAVLGSAAVSLQ